MQTARHGNNAALLQRIGRIVDAPWNDARTFDARAVVHAYAMAAKECVFKAQDWSANVLDDEKLAAELGGILANVRGDLEHLDRVLKRAARGGGRDV